FHDDRGRLEHRAAVHPLGGPGRHLHRSRTRARRDDGGHLRAGQRTFPDRVAAGAGQLDRRDDRERIRRGRFADVPEFPDRARLPAVRRHLHRAVDRAADAARPREARGHAMSAVADRLYFRRRLANGAAMLLSGAATVFGLFWLVWILWTTVSRGLAA